LIKTASYSRLKIFEKCPYHALLKFVEKREPAPDAKRDAAKDRGTAIHTQAENFVKGELDALPPELKKFQDSFLEAREAFGEGRVILEEEWAFDIDWQPTGWFADDCWLRVKLDRYEWLDDDLTAARYTDYKTGKKIGNEVDHGQQNQHYAIAAFMRYPSLQVTTGIFEYLDQPAGDNRTVKTYTREKCMQFFPSVDARYKKMTSATHFPPKPNRINCRYCPYSPNNEGDKSCPHGVEV